MSEEVQVQVTDISENDAEPTTLIENEFSANTESDVIGKVASPPRRESTSEQFHFWVPRGQLVEKTQIVRTQSRRPVAVINGSSRS